MCSVTVNVQVSDVTKVSVFSVQCSGGTKVSVFRFQVSAPVILGIRGLGH